MSKIKIPKRIRNHVNPLAITDEYVLEKFQNKNNVIIDIGSYRGEFMQKVEEKFKKEKNYILFEIRKPFQKYLKEVFKGKENVRIYGGDASRSLKKMLSDLEENGNFVEKIFINFPDP